MPRVCLEEELQKPKIKKYDNVFRYNTIISKRNEKFQIIILLIIISPFLILVIKNILISFFN